MPGILNVSGASSTPGKKNSGSIDPMQLLLKGSRPSILSRKIGFVPGKSSVTASNGDGKKKTFTTSYAGGSSRSSNSTSQDLQLTWKKAQSIGPGLVNLGNTCFLNSVLQCLTYTPPLAQALANQPHDCQSPSACTMHAMESHVRKSLSSSSSAFCPKTIISKLKAIAKHFRMGRQEDSHEFMLHLLDAMEKSCHGKKPAQKDSGIVNGVFGGAIQSQVKCLSCKHESNTIDPVMDLCLEIKNCDSLEKALALYTKAELLSGRNRYKCEKCVFYP
jgi:ubiquitin C-terminal hydrolase